MHPVLNILRRDLAGMPRRRWFYLKRVALIGLGAAILLWGLGLTRWSYNQAIGLQIFMPLAFCAVLAMMLVAPATGSGAILREREERTLGLLFLSGVTSRQFLLGKLAVALFTSILTILSVLPLFMLAVSLGGVGASQVFAAFGLLLATVFLGACIGLFAAAVAPSEKTAGSVLLLVGGLLYLVLPVMVSMIEGLYFNRDPEREATLLSPVVAMTAIVSGRLSWSCLAHGGYSLVVGLLLLWGAGAAIPRRVLTRDAPEPSLRWRERIKAVRSLSRWVDRPPVSGNPVAWRETFFVQGGPRSAWGKFALGIGSLMVMVALMGWALHSGRNTRLDWNDEIATPALMVTLWVSLIVWGISSIHDFGNTFSRERRTRTLELLLTTTLTDDEIVWGKVRATLQASVPWMTGVLVAGFGLLVLQAHAVLSMSFDDLVKIALTLGTEFFSMWFGYSALALLISLRFRRNVALAVCLLTFGVWNTLVRGAIGVMLAQVASSLWPMVVLDAVVHGALGLICLHLVFQQLRATSAMPSD